MRKFVVWDVERAKLVTPAPTDKRSAYAFADVLERRNGTNYVVAVAE